MSTDANLVDKGTLLPLSSQTAKKSPSTANNQVRPNSQLLSDWNAVERLLSQSINQNQTVYPPTPGVDSADPALNVVHAQADLLSLLDSFTQGTSPIPFLLELVQTWSLSESCDMSLRMNQSNLRLILNLAAYLTEIRESYNNYAFFLDQVEQMNTATGGQCHE